jgi:acyl carrier protein
VTAVLDIMGLKEENIGENDDLSKMGIDSMQVVEVRATVQRALGRPFPLEEVGSFYTSSTPLTRLSVVLTFPCLTFHMCTCILAIPRAFNCPFTLLTMC